MLYPVLGWALLAVGIAGVLVALFVDRSRGRRRCPRCYYDMSDTEDRVCPECGRRAAHEGLMYTTRRHWRWAFIAALPLLAVKPVWMIPTIQSGGWPAVTPLRVLIWNFESLDDWDAQWAASLNERIGLESTPDRLRRALLRKAIAVAGNPHADTPDRVRAVRTIADSEGSGGGGFYRHWTRRPVYAQRVSSYSVDFDGAFAALLACVRDADTGLRHIAAHALGAYYPSFGTPKPGDLLPTRHAYPAVAALLCEPSPGPGQTHMFMNSVGRSPFAVWRLLYGPDVDRPLNPAIASWASLAGDRDAAVAQLVEGANHEDWTVAVVALWGLLALDAETADARAALQRALGRAEPDVRETATAVFAQLVQRGRQGFDEAFFEAATADPDPMVRSAARDGVLALDPIPSLGVRVMAEIIEEGGPAARAWAPHAERLLASDGTVHDDALARLARAVEEHIAQTNETAEPEPVPFNRQLVP